MFWLKRTFASRDSAVYFAGIILFVYCVGIMLGPIPDGHDTYISFSHVEIWENALRAGNPVPTWTPVDANGFGSPVPFFYHKLFNLIAAALALATGDIVTGFRLGILLFSAVMLYGVYQCAARLGADRRSCLIIAVACILSPYSVVCVLERGAVAEYSAMALIPLGIAFTIDVVTGARKTWQTSKLFILLILLALAHLVIFIAADGMLILLSGYMLTKSRIRGGFLLAASGSAMLLFVVLVYVPFTVWAAYFCPGQARLHGLPAENAVAFQRIFSPMPGSWFGWPILALLIGLAVQFRYKKGRGATITIVLGVAAFVVTLFMTRLAAPVWRSSALLDFVQFPWRLLSITTPMIFVAFAGMIGQLPPTLKRYTQFVLLTVTVLNVGGELRYFHRIYAAIPVTELRHQTASTGPGPDAGGEYFPARYQKVLAATPDILAVKASSVLPGPRTLVESKVGCGSGQVGSVPYFNTLQVHATCDSEGVVQVNQFYTPFLDVKGTSADGTVYRPVPSGPFIAIALPKGSWTIQVRQRTYLELVKMAWESKLGFANTH
jgi:hypothetical protein